ncbi:hypothetical protein BZG04_15285 [Salinivibrio kushneri]|nr:hypothetical protein BZG04_15285 [Salinivibrio kushneri]OOE49304.1 hypothetical protein BZG12_16065 [Salinivibrio kushneri]
MASQSYPNLHSCKSFHTPKTHWQNPVAGLVTRTIPWRTTRQLFAGFLCVALAHLFYGGLVEAASAGRLQGSGMTSLDQFTTQ